MGDQIRSKRPENQHYCTKSTWSVYVPAFECIAEGVIEKRVCEQAETHENLAQAVYPPFSKQTKQNLFASPRSVAGRVIGLVSTTVESSGRTHGQRMADPSSV